MTPERIAQTLIYPYLNHAARMLESGYATAVDIDNGMRFGCGYPAGPISVIDETSASAVVEVLADRYAETGDSMHAPAALLLASAQSGTPVGAAGIGENPHPELRHEITSVGVVGTGTMATGIIQVFAQTGYDVVYVGRGEGKVAGVAAAIAKAMDKAIARGKASEDDKSNVLGRLTGSTEREALGDVDLVVEAVAEDLAVKTDLYKDLDRICKPGAILATTTSSMPITSLAEVTARPQDVIGMHFFNPAPVMKLVEVVTTAHTGEDVDETVRALCASAGKVAVSCGDRSGFIVNCLLFPYLNDAVKLAETGVAIADIDAAIKSEVGLPMGPFELLDVVGNDVSLAIEQELYSEFKEPGFAPASLLRTKVAAGELGRKSGKGFYDYS